MRNPVIFVTGLTALLVTLLVGKDALTGGADLAIGVQVAVWLWFTVLFANFAEATPHRVSCIVNGLGSPNCIVEIDATAYLGDKA